MVVGVHLLLVSVFPAGVIAAALYDATSYTIPNRLSALIALAFFPAAVAFGATPLAVAMSAGLGIAALAAGVALFAAGCIGGGDAKLLAACALWLGWTATAPFVIWTGVAGGVLAVALLLLRRVPALATARGPAWVARLLEPSGPAPYGVAIAAGALAAFPVSPLFRLAFG